MTISLYKLEWVSNVSPKKNWFLKASGNKLDITKLVEINWEKLVKNKCSKYASVISNEGR